MKYKNLIAGFLLAIFVVSAGFITNDNYFEISKNLDIFGKLYREINLNYVDETDPEKLMRVGIEAMLSTLDPYTSYVSEEEAETFTFLSTGQYGGIGALVGKRDKRILIIEPYEDYPADKSGLIAGDQLIEIGGTQVKPEFNISDVRNLLRGEQGSEVKIKVKRGEDFLDLKVIRGKIKIDNVPYYGMIEEGIGYISLTGFTQDAGKEVQKALESLKKEDKKMKGVILDLRGNPGGRLDEAVNVSNVFIPAKEVIVETKGRKAESRKVYQARRASSDTKIPLTVLINRSSASASEIVAGAVQDLDRGVIIGQRSFGKGLVQNVRPLKYNSQLKITTAKYYTPSGRCIQALNYANRDKNGRAIRIADSLRKTYYTRNGRPVKDGGGIAPDINIEYPKPSPLVFGLDNQGLIFDFATSYASKNPSLPSPTDFHVDDQIYQEFVQYVKAKDFTYRTAADAKLDELKETLESEAYLNALNSEFEALEKAVEEQKNNDFEADKHLISLMLEEEIAKRYYYKKGILEVHFDDDPEIISAISLLKDKDRYQNILSGKN